MGHPTLQNLTLKDVLKERRDKEDCTSLSSGLAQNTTLRSLDIKLHNQNLPAVADGIRQNSTLARLSIKFGREEPVEHRRLTEALTTNESLRSISLRLPDRRHLETHYETIRELYRTLAEDPRLTEIFISDGWYRSCKHCETSPGENATCKWESRKNEVI